MQLSVFVQELLELKRLQIRAPKANEEVIVKQLTETIIYNITYFNIQRTGKYSMTMCQGDREAADRDFHLYIIYISTSREQGNIAWRCAKVIVKQLTERFNGTMKSLASQGETTIELSEKYNTLHIFLTFPFTLSISSKKKTI